MQALESELTQKASDVSAMLKGETPVGEAGGNVSPDDVAAASAKLVEQGLLTKPETSVTPAFKAAIEKAIDQSGSTGLYDLNNPNDMMKAVRDVASGMLGSGDGSGGMGVSGRPAEPDDDGPRYGDAIG